MSKRKIVFMYPGQGCQYFHMCRELFFHDVAFRDSLKSLDGLVKKEIGNSIIDYVFSDQVNISMPFSDTLYSSQAVFCFEYAMTQSLLSYGVYPDYLLGASLGEIVCAAVSGALSTRECIGLLAASARVLAQTCERGGMLSVFAPPDLFEQDAVLHTNSEIASLTFDQHFVIAGELAQIDKIEAHLRAGKHMSSRLPVEYGFHSAAIDPARLKLNQHYLDCAHNRPIVPTLSCQQSGFVACYDVRHFDAVLRQPIRFRQTIAMLEKQGCFLYLDVSPSGTLSTYCKYLLDSQSDSLTVPVTTPFARHKTIDPIHWMPSS